MAEKDGRSSDVTNTNVWPKWNPGAPDKQDVMMHQITALAAMQQADNQAKANQLANLRNEVQVTRQILELVAETTGTDISKLPATRVSRTTTETRLKAADTQTVKTLEPGLKAEILSISKGYSERDPNALKRTITENVRTNNLVGKWDVEVKTKLVGNEVHEAAWGAMAVSQKEILYREMAKEIYTKRPADDHKGKSSKKARTTTSRKPRANTNTNEHATGLGSSDVEVGGPDQDQDQVQEEQAGGHTGNTRWRGEADEDESFNGTTFVESTSQQHTVSKRGKT